MDEGISFKRIDWISIFLYLSLSVLGLASIYSSTYSFFIDSDSFLTLFNKQLIFIGISLFLGIGLLLIKVGFYKSFSNIFYILGILLLIGVLLFGKKVSSAASWYSIGGFSFQPSEFSKIATSLFLARFLSQTQTNISKIQDSLVAISIIVLPVILVAMQPDAGTMLVFVMLSAVLFGEGLNKHYLLPICLLVIGFPITLKFGVFYTVFGSAVVSTIIIVWVKKKVKMLFNKSKLIFYIIFCLVTISAMSFGTNFIYSNVFKSHHQDRFKLWLNLENASTMKEIKRNIGYNTYQSEKAISSGGLKGKGFLKGSRTKGKFIPEQHTDYIFTVVGEEWGFLGTLTVITLFSLLIIRIISQSSRQKIAFNRIYGYCVAIILSVHYVINIGMVMGLIPTIGIPLPYFSYGGSAFLGFSVLLFIYIRLNSQKTGEWLHT